MKVYTKTGDKGLTGLIGGTRVKKHHIRIETYGTIDELNSYVGLIRDKALAEIDRKFLIDIQDRLFTLGSILASDPSKSKMTLPELTDKDVHAIEMRIDEMDKELEPMRSFVLPGGHETVSFVHITRCVCRRAERLISALIDDTKTDYGLGLKYINRLSDYLFVYSRYLSKHLSADEIPWVPKV